MAEVAAHLCVACLEAPGLELPSALSVLCCYVNVALLSGESSKHARQAWNLQARIRLTH